MALQSEGGKKGRTAMAGESILIIDDNATNSKLAAFVLQRAGFEVRTAADVVEARAAIAQRQPALILMDLQLPGVDGLTFTRELKGNPTTAGIVIVALTAYAMKGDEERARAAGADGYVSKPIETRTFAATVASHLAKGETK